MRTLLLTLALSLISAAAFAQEGPRRPPRTVIDFSEVRISGTVARPAIEYVRAVRGARFRSLVRSRTSFVGELDRSIDAL